MIPKVAMSKVIREDWPHGLRCMDCDEPLLEGYCYSRRLVGFCEDSPVTEIVCIPCSLGLETPA